MYKGKKSKLSNLENTKVVESVHPNLGFEKN